MTGELIYTTDSKAVFVGDGTTAGGVPVAVGGSGNVSGTNLLTSGIASAAGNVTGSNLLGSVMSASGNVTGGNIVTSGLITVTGNVQAGNLRTVGLVSATGTITGSQFNGSGAGRDKSLHALNNYSALKTTWVDLS